jgi:amidase
MPFAPSLDTLGVLARSVADAALVRAILLQGGADAPAATRTPRLALCRTPWWGEADAAVQSGIEQVCARLSAHAMEVGEATLPAGFESLAETQKAVMAFEAAASLRLEVAQHRERLSEAVRALVAAGEHIDAARHRKALDEARAHGDALGEVFARHDVLVTPAVHGEAPAGLGATGDPLFSRAWTLLGLPTLTLPALRAPTGLPIGIQLVAARGADALLLTAAAAVEAALGAAEADNASRSTLWRAP